MKWSEKVVGLRFGESSRGPVERRSDGTLILSSRQGWQAVVMWRRALVADALALLLSDMMAGLEGESTCKSTFVFSVRHGNKAMEQKKHEARVEGMITNSNRLAG